MNLWAAGRKVMKQAKKIRVWTVADAALSMLIILSDKKRRIVKRFFMYRRKVKKIKIANNVYPLARKW
jgi:hypothetical protein